MKNDLNVLSKRMLSKLGTQCSLEICNVAKYRALKAACFSARFLLGVDSSHKVDIRDIHDKVGDTRIDMPVWFNDVEKGKYRIIVLGMMPRASFSCFNIRRDDNRVYACAFAADKWLSDDCCDDNGSQIKSHKAYYRVLEQCIERGTFVYLSDVYKKYENKYADKIKNDKYNTSKYRQTFCNVKTPDACQEDREQAIILLNDEVAIIKPQIIFCLGNDSFRGVNSIINNIGQSDFKALAAYKVLEDDYEKAVITIEKTSVRVSEMRLIIKVLPHLACDFLLTKTGLAWIKTRRIGGF